MIDHRWRPSGRLIVLMVAVVLLGLWQLTSGIRGTVDVLDTEPTVPTVALTEVPEATLDGPWSRVDLPGRTRLRNVWDVGGTLYASGWDSGARKTVVWSSPDGALWRPLATDEDQFDRAAIYDMIGFDGLVIAVGARLVSDHPVFDQIAVPALWRSFDGESFIPVVGLDVAFWASSDAESSEAFGIGGFTSVKTFGDGLIVGGWEGAGDLLTGNGDTRGSVWFSEDGVSFVHSVDASDTLGGTGTIVRTLTSDGEALVAGGASSGRATVWTSADATSWMVVAGSPEQGSSVLAATVGPQGVLVMGKGVIREGEDVSDALRLWANVAGSYVVIEPSGLEAAELADVGVGGFGLVAVGAVTLDDDSTVGAIWSSPDGVAWERVSVETIPRGSILRAVVVGEQAIVAVGEVHGQPSVWVRRIKEGDDAVAGVGSLVAPPAWSTVFQQDEAIDAVPTSMQRAGDFLYGLASSEWLWQSRDGDVWTLQDFESVGLGEADSITQIVAASAGWVAIGESEGGRLWSSEDGQQWGRPTLAPPCCPMALFREGRGFVVLVRDERAGIWLRAVTSDGLVWEVDDDSVDLPVESIDRVASIGPLGLLWGVPIEGAGGVWGTIDGRDWFAIPGPNGVFAHVTWDQVWDLGGEVVASGTLDDEPVLFRTTDGAQWQSLALPGLGSESLVVVDVGGFGDGLAVLVSYGGRATRLLTFSGVGVQEEIPLEVESGFTGLWSMLVPNDVSLRMVGPDHGRMTIWEWIPEPGISGS